MEIVRNVNIDWLGKAKYFMAVSAILLVAGVGSWLSKDRTFRYSVDFKGGTQVYVRFAQEPSIEQIRQGLATQGLGSSLIQRISDVTTPDVHEVRIELEQLGEGEESLDAGKNAILEALRKTFGGVEAGKQDFNATTPAALEEFLLRRDPLGRGSAAGDTYKQMSRDILAVRDADHSGLITSFDQLKAAPGVTDAVISTLHGDFALSTFAVSNVEIVGPKVGAQLRRQAVLATLYALAGMLVYIAFRFEWVYGAAAVLAVFHDVLITLGFFSLLNYEISLTVIAALLTLVGYSMNDTIVIFDRMRENLKMNRREPLPELINRSINQTLSRTILTSGLTFLTVLVLYLMGGQVLRTFSFALVVGIMVGTYSSVGIAAPFVVAWSKWRGPGAVAGRAARTKTA